MTPQEKKEIAEAIKILKAEKNPDLKEKIAHLEKLITPKKSK